MSAKTWSYSDVPENLLYYSLLSLLHSTPPCHQLYAKLDLSLTDVEVDTCSDVDEERVVCIRILEDIQHTACRVLSATLCHVVNLSVGSIVITSLIMLTLIMSQTLETSDSSWMLATFFRGSTSDPASMNHVRNIGWQHESLCSTPNVLAWPLERMKAIFRLPGFASHMR